MRETERKKVTNEQLGVSLFYIFYRLTYNINIQGITIKTTYNRTAQAVRPVWIKYRLVQCFHRTLTKSH